MAGYTRQSSYTDGDVITAAHSNDEFNQVLAAFVNTTGNKHDGTAAEGPVIGLIGDPGETTPLNKVVIDNPNNQIEFSVDVSSSSVEQFVVKDGVIEPTTDNDIDLGSSSKEFKDLYIDGTAHLDAINFNGTAITSTAAELNILDGVTATAAELNIMDGGTAASSTTVADADRVVFNDNGTMKQVAVTDLAAYFDDEITAMPNLVTTAATTVGALNSGSITSGFGTIDTGSSTITTTGLITGGSLDIDDVVINGSTIGHTDDTDLITVANGVVTVAGEVSMTTLDIGGTNVTSTATELNKLDGATVTTTEINYLDITTLGTSEASKAVTVDSNGDLLVPDSDKFKFGAGSDMQLYHDGTNSYITNGTGILKIATETSGIAINIGHGT